MAHFALIPAYNEEKNIEEVLLRLKKNPKIIPLVVDDGSTDRTSELVRKLNVKLLRHAVNKGKGEALKTGFEYILKNYPEARDVILIDADMQYLPEEIDRIWKPLDAGEADFVMGYRDWSKVPFRHRIGNFIWKTFFNLLFGTNFKDTNCGYMGLTREAIKKIKRVHGGYIIENTFFVEALKNNLRIKQVPVTVVYKEKRDLVSGIKMELGVLTFILVEGFKYRLGIKG